MFRKYKTRKLNIATKQMIFIGLTVWLTICMIVAIVTNNRRNDMVELAGEECIAISSLLGAYIDVDDLVQLKPGMEDSEIYKSIQNQLNHAMNKTNMEYVYTLWTDGSNIYYGVDGDLENTAEFGSVFEESYDYLDDGFKGEIICDKDLVKSNGHYYISAYVPLYDEDGSVVSLLSCDFNADEIYSRIRSAWNMLFLYATFGLVVSGFLLLFIVSLTVKRLMRLNSKIEELANSNGDLTKTIDINSGDEVEILANSVNNLLSYIRNIMVNIDRSAKDLNQMSIDLSNNVVVSKENAEDISALIEEMSASTEETAAAIEELVSSTNQISDVTSNFAVKSKEAKEYSNSLNEEANHTYNAALKEKDLAEEKAMILEASIQEKIKQSKAVEEIKLLISTILDITTQTNLLSLNASIEAARAGDAGRGFAVVATEIGKLAKDSANAAKKIQEVSQKVITAVDELALEANNMSDFIKTEALNGYNQLIDVSKKNQENMNEISNTLNYIEEETAHVNGTIADINSNLENINIAMDQNAEGISSSAMALSDLILVVDKVDVSAQDTLKFSNILNEEVNKFKI